VSTHTSVTKKLAAAVVAAATSASVGLATVPAHAAPMPSETMVLLGKPTSIGPVTGLTASVTKPTDAYRVTATWNALAAATAYDVSLTAGTFTAKARVTDPRWTTDVKAPVNTLVSIKVVPVAAIKGKKVPKTTSLVLPDLTAPVGQYELVLDSHTGTATVTETALSDDVTARDQIQRSIDWDMGAGWETWASELTTTYSYLELGRYEPRLRLTDEAGNSRVVPLKVVVTGDLTDPTGTFTTTPLKAWAKYTKVVVTQTDIEDNVTPDEYIVRSVNWGDGDGSSWVPWTAGSALRHVYTAGGTYTPRVKLVDEAGREAYVDSTPVTVRVDSAAPKVTIAVPKRRAAYVASWKTLRGTARDYVGSGVNRVWVRVVEKRGATWYAYRAPGKRWVRAGSTRASAMRQTRVGIAYWRAGRWSLSVARLRKGTIVVKVNATDRVGNASKPVWVSKRLTR
jgi:hypothetical protein